MTENVKESISSRTKESKNDGKMEKQSSNDKMEENITLIDNYLRQLVNFGNNLGDLRRSSKQELSEEIISNKRISSTNENDNLIKVLKHCKIPISEDKNPTVPNDKSVRQVEIFRGHFDVSPRPNNDNDDFLESEEYCHSVNVFNESDFGKESQEEKTSTEDFQQFPKNSKKSSSKNSNIGETENDKLREYFPIIYKNNQRDFIKMQKIFHDNLSERNINDDSEHVFNNDEDSDEDGKRYLDRSPSDLKTNTEEPIENDIYERSYNLFSRSQTIDSVKLTCTYRKSLGDTENGLSSKELKFGSNKFVQDSDVNLQLENSFERSFSTVSNQFKKALIKTNNFPLDFHQLSELSKISDNRYICISGEDVNRQLLETESQETETNYLISYPCRSNDYEDQSLDNLNHLSLSASLKNEVSNTFNDFSLYHLQSLKRVFIKTVNSTNKGETEEMEVSSMKYNLLKDYFPELDPNIIAQITNLKPQPLRLPSIPLDSSKDSVTFNKRINTTLQYSNDDEPVLRPSKMKTQATQFHNLVINGKQLMFRDSDLLTLNSMRKKFPEDYNHLKNIFISAKKMKNEKKEENCLDSACYKVLYGKSSDYSRLLLDAINSKNKYPIKQLSRSKSHELTTGISKTNLPNATSNVVLPQVSLVNENVLETYSLIAETKTKLQNFNPISYSAGYLQSAVPLPNQIESKSIFERTPGITKKKSYIKTIHTSIVNDAANMNRLLPSVKLQNGDLLNVRDKINIKKNKILMEKTERRYKKIFNEEMKKKTRSDNFITNYSEEYFDSFMNFYDALQVKQNLKSGRHYNLSQKVFRRPSSRISGNQDLDLSIVHESHKVVDDKNIEKLYKSYRKPFVISSDHFSKFTSNKNIA